jgi:hypothetical protein
LPPKEFEAFLKDVGMNPIRSFGGASSMGSGRLELMEFKVA